MADKANQLNKEQDKAQSDYQKLVDQAVSALQSTGLDVQAQLNIVLADGTRVPIQGIVAQPVVIKNAEPQNPDAGKGSNVESVPPETKQ